MPLDAQISTLLQQLNQAGAAAGPLSIHQVRAAIGQSEATGPADSDARDVHARHPDGHEVQIRLYGTAGARAATPVIIYIHGGGWATGDNSTHAATARQLADMTGFIVAAIDYRLAPEHRFPAGLSDCDVALRWIATRAPEFGGDPDRLLLVGDSAGGNLAAALTVILRDSAGPTVRFQVLLYPNMDTDLERWPSMQENGTGYLLTAEMMRWFQDLYCEPGELRDPRVAPLLTESLEGLPPALVVTAEYDPLRDQGEAYARRLSEAGVPVTMWRHLGQIHGFFRLPDDFEGTVLVRKRVADALLAAVR